MGVGGRSILCSRFCLNASESEGHRRADDIYCSGHIWNDLQNLSEKPSDIYPFSVSGKVWEECIFSCWPLRVCWHNPQRVNIKCFHCGRCSVGSCPPELISNLPDLLPRSPITLVNWHIQEKKVKKISLSPKDTACLSTHILMCFFILFRMSPFRYPQTN